MKSWKGVYTIEIALLMPIIMSAVLAVIYAVFLFHDKNRIEAEINASIIRSKRILRHDLSSEDGRIDYNTINDGDVYNFMIGNYDEKAKVCVKYLEEKLKDGLFLLKADRTIVTMEREQIKYQVEVQCRIALPLIHNLMNKRKSIIRKEIKYQDAPDFVRKTVGLLGGDFGDSN